MPPRSTLATSTSSKPPPLQSQISPSSNQHRSATHPPLSSSEPTSAASSTSPKDLVFLLKLFTLVTWSMIRLHCLELPFLIVTRFRYSTKHHPIGWSWFMTLAIAFIRRVGPLLQTVGQLRFVGLFVEGSLPIQNLFARNVKVEKSIAFKVNLDALLRPERATLAQVRQLLREKGASDDVMNPSSEYLHSMHPPSHGPNARVANMPEVVGVLDNYGNYQLKGEWIEALVDPKKPETRPRSQTVILYFHGGK
ncbi:hypothetical protein BG006_010323 [Podila minutissima]|uniref:Uncharacterized protein n=1 Tax=Podila minutissima TaxID=64525 RepID=A0A9P5SQ73_9FUNG|nr:hypothetical protein BG006_010323 [Podila minutissima]